MNTPLVNIPLVNKRVTQDSLSGTTANTLSQFYILKWHVMLISTHLTALIVGFVIITMGVDEERMEHVDQ